LTHGYYSYNAKTKDKKVISATSLYFESLPYRVDPETGLVDFEALQNSVNLFKPNMIICGGSECLLVCSFPFHKSSCQPATFPP
jgi:glycine hydroxymethyltransferase